MKYSDYKHQIKTGDLLVWSDSSVGGASKTVGKLIRFFTMSEYCHVGIAWVIGNRIFVIEAVPPVIRIYPLSKLLPCYHISMDLEVKEEDVEFLLSHVGEEYSRFQAILSYFTAPSPDSEWQCVEFSRKFYERFGYQFKDSWTPSDFVKTILSFSAEEKQFSLQYIDA